MDALYIKTPQYRYGPLKTTDAPWFIEEGLSTDRDLVWTPKTNEWTPIGKIEQFKPYFDKMKKKTGRSKVYAFASGKGGVGKTAITASMAIELGALGKKVIIVDADLGGPDLHEWVGVSRPPITLNTFFQYKGVKLQQLLVETPYPNVQLIGGEIANIAHSNPNFFSRSKFHRHLHQLEADFVLVDMSPGVSYQTIDLFLACDNGIIVTIPDPTSFMDAFNFIRVSIIRKLLKALEFCEFSTAKIKEFEHWDWQKYENSLYSVFEKIQNYDPRAASFFMATIQSFKPKMVTNMVYSEEEASEAAAFKEKIKKLLMIDINYLGYIDFSNQLRKLTKDMRPFGLSTPDEGKAYEPSKIQLSFPQTQK